MELNLNKEISFDVDINDNINEKDIRQKRKKISSPPNEFLVNSNYENSAETNYKKISSETSSIFSSSSDNDDSVELDSFMNSFRLKRVKL